MTSPLTVGDPAPEFTLPDANGSDVSLSDYRGQRVIVYFYPKASTPGCTTQACDFRDNLAAFTTEGFAVLGISPDAPAALQRFTDKQELTFPLLSDEDHSVAEAYGAWGEKKNYGKTVMGVIRSTFVVEADGTLSFARYNVRAKGHVAMVAKLLDVDLPESTEG